MKPRILAVLAAALLLGACAGALPWNEQNWSGINHGRITFTGEGEPLEIVIYGGKESGTVKLSGKLPSGVEFAYEAVDVRAFEGQALRASVEKALGDDVVEAFPGAVDGIVSLLTEGP